MAQQRNHQNGHDTGLTCIHSGIQWASTADTTEGEHTETDRIIMEHFLDTMAEIALSVASRTVTERDEWSRPNEREQ